MAGKKYQKVTEQIMEFYTDCLFDGKSVSDVMQWLSELSETHSEYTSLWFLVERGYDDAADSLALYGSRPETDQERDKRLDKARKLRQKKAQDKQKREEFERAEYERLRAKFEGV